jgi:hypothetical protein
VEISHEFIVQALVSAGGCAIMIGVAAALQWAKLQARGGGKSPSALAGGPVAPQGGE